MIYALCDIVILIFAFFVFEKKMIYLPKHCLDKRIMTESKMLKHILTT